MTTAWQRRGLFVIAALILVSSFSLFSYQSETRYLPRYHGATAVSSPSGPTPTAETTPKEDGLGYAFYDYIHNFPTQVVKAEIPEAVTGAPKSTMKLALDQRTTSSAEPAKTDPPPHSFSPPAYEPAIASLPNRAYSKLLVVTRKKSDDISWLEDLRKADPLLGSIVYDTHDEEAHNYVPSRAAAFLTYITTFYDDLRDMTLFLHAHKAAWALDPMMNSSASTAIQRMDDQHVMRQGYFNMRCKLDPGCPGIYLRPEDKERNPADYADVPEIWRDFFGDSEPPHRFNSPAYGQIAVSRARIRAIPREQYRYFLARLEASTRDTKVLETFWSQTWAYLWFGNATYCPVEMDCFCQGYGVCFDGEEEYKSYTTIEAGVLQGQTTIAGIKEEDDPKRVKLVKEVQEMQIGLGEIINAALGRGKTMHEMLNKGANQGDQNGGKGPVESTKEPLDTSTQGVKEVIGSLTEYLAGSHHD